MRALWFGLLCWLLCGPVCAAPDPGFSDYLRSEKSIQRHERSLASLSLALEEWLSGRQGVEATRKSLQVVKAELATKLELPQASANKILTSEKQMVDSAERFLRAATPDAAGQLALFESLNASTRDRAIGLLQWRTSKNRELAKKSPNGVRATYLAWEANWLAIWKEEAEIAYRLQKAFLSSQGRQSSDGKPFVRELLALQTKAGALKAPPSLSAMSELALKRLTLLARAAEQLERVGAGSRGALTRLRKLHREQVEADRQLQDQRLETLSQLTKG